MTGQDDDQSREHGSIIDYHDLIIDELIRFNALLICLKSRVSGLGLDSFKMLAIALRFLAIIKRLEIQLIGFDHAYEFFMITSATCFSSSLLTASS